MTALVWDKVGEKVYQTGVDRGVLYLRSGHAVSWNGLTGIEESSSTELKSFWLDGVKYLDNLLPGDFSGKLKAFTYPDEFDEINGVATVAPGLSYYDQQFQSFNLSYRTIVGNDLDGVDHGYKIHLLYNLIANPDSIAFDTLKDTAVQPIEFSWSLSGIPAVAPGHRPTVHISIDSRGTKPEILEAIEEMLYGTATTAPHFPTINEILNLFESLGALIIIDNGDGTWQAIDNGNDYITMLNPTTFQIDNSNAVFLDATTYRISTTTPS